MKASVWLASALSNDRLHQTSPASYIRSKSYLICILSVLDNFKQPPPKPSTRYKSQLLQSGTFFYHFAYLFYNHCSHNSPLHLTVIGKTPRYPSHFILKINKIADKKTDQQEAVGIKNLSFAKEFSVKKNSFATDNKTSAYVVLQDSYPNNLTP